jgi:hypothetical protein
MSTWRNTRKRLPARTRVRVLAALAALLAGCALALGACGDTLQDRPIPHNTLESLIVAPYPVYWLGGSFRGLQITDASHDPSGAFSVQYGDCVVGGQSTCVTPVTVITSPDNSFVAGGSSPQSTASLRGVQAVHAQHGRRRGQRLRRQREPGKSGCAHDRADQRRRRTGCAAAGAPAGHELRLDAAALAGALAAARAALKRRMQPSLGNQARAAALSESAQRRPRAAGARRSSSA